MFTTFGMEQCRRDDYDPDASLEYSEEETYQQFLDFYDDVLPEFKNVGKVIQFKVGVHDAHEEGDCFTSHQSALEDASARAQAVCLGGACAMAQGLVQSWAPRCSVNVTPLPPVLVACTAEGLPEIRAA